jgi:hypothetical protein
MEEGFMKRREMLAVPGVAGIAAFAAGRAFGQTQGGRAPVGTTPTISRKALSKESTTKAGYALPKNAAKQAKYLSSLTALLSLSQAQQQQAASIFTTAVNNRIGINSTIKSVRKVLATAVTNNAGSGWTTAAEQIGTLTTQFVANGAAANAAFYQTLTPSQQITLSQYQGVPGSDLQTAQNER